MDSLLRAPVLVVDDLGAHSSADWVETKVDQLLTHRFNAQMPTVVVLAKSVSDLTPRIAAKLSDENSSRILQLTPYEQSRTGIPQKLLDEMTFETFETYKRLRTDEPQKHLLNLVLGTARNFVGNPDQRTWLYIQGDTGVGKTHLAIAIAKESIEKGVSVMYSSLPDLLDRLRSTYSTRNESAFFSLFESVKNKELLILDDFGTQQMTEWSLEKLYQLFTFRHERGMRTVVAGHIKIYPDEGETKQQTVQHKSIGRPSEVESASESSGSFQMSSRHQWKSIISRLGDEKTVTVLSLPVPDYRFNELINTPHHSIQIR